MYLDSCNKLVYLNLENHFSVKDMVNFSNEGSIQCFSSGIVWCKVHLYTYCLEVLYWLTVRLFLSTAIIAVPFVSCHSAYIEQQSLVSILLLLFLVFCGWQCFKFILLAFK